MRGGSCLGLSVMSAHLSPLPPRCSCSTFPGQEHSTAGQLLLVLALDGTLGSRGRRWEQETGESCPSRTPPSIQDHSHSQPRAHLPGSPLIPNASCQKLTCSQPTALCPGLQGQDRDRCWPQHLGTLPAGSSHTGQHLHWAHLPSHPSPEPSAALTGRGSFLLSCFTHIL